LPRLPSRGVASPRRAPELDDDVGPPPVRPDSPRHTVEEVQEGLAPAQGSQAGKAELIMEHDPVHREGLADLHLYARKPRGDERSERLDRVAKLTTLVRPQDREPPNQEISTVGFDDPNGTLRSADASQLCDRRLGVLQVMQNVPAQNGVERPIPERESESVTAHKAGADTLSARERQLAWEQVAPNNKTRRGRSRTQQVDEISSLAAAHFEDRVSGHDREPPKQGALGVGKVGVPRLPEEVRSVRLLEKALLVVGEPRTWSAHARFRRTLAA
jgi:hypothetical protein